MFTQIYWLKHIKLIIFLFYQSAISRFYKSTRKACHEDVSDINMTQQSSMVRAGRHIDPLNPQYRLASYVPFVAPESNGGYDATLVTADIQGASANPKFYNHQLHKVPEIRNEQFDVKDVNFPPELITLKQQRGPVIREGNPLLDVTDINGQKLQQIKRTTDPLSPVYSWKLAEEGNFVADPFKNLQNQRDYVKEGDFSLKTDDICGIDEDRLRKMRKCGYARETYDNMNVVDINQKKEIAERTQPLEFHQKYMENSPQYEPSTYQSQIVKKNNISQKQDSKQTFENSYQNYEELRKSGIIDKPTFRKPGNLDPPLYVPPPASEVKEKHYLVQKEVKRGVLHETIGSLPGPQACVYQAKLDAGYKHSTAHDIMDGKDFSKEITANPDKIFVKPLPTSGLFSISPKEQKQQLSYTKQKNVSVSASPQTKQTSDAQKMKQTQRQQDIELIQSLD